MSIESRSIDYIPECERHGRVADQGMFWFLSNFHFFAIAIGFVGPSLGLSLPYTVLAGIVGTLFGTTFQAFHASQGAELGLPQMIQSRAQFGYRGVIVPLLASFANLIGYNVVAAVLVTAGLHSLWAVDQHIAAVATAVLALVLAIWGYDYLHFVFRILFWISLPLICALSLFIILGRAGGTAPVAVDFHWAAFMAQLAAAASFNISAAPYVSDYSRYLPTRTPRVTIIFHVFVGSALSAMWLIAVGAWLATHMGVTDALLALKTCGDLIRPGFGAILAATSIAALVATVAMTGYSAMLTAITTWDSLKSVRPTRRLRIWVLCAVTILWATLAMSCHEDAIVYLNAMLVLVLYFLMPWTAVNLVDYFILRRGRYSLHDLFTPTGIYGAWGYRGLLAYAIGFLASAPFFVVPGLFTGPLAAQLAGVDIGWLVSPLSASLAYLCLSRHFDAAGEIRAIKDNESNLPMRKSPTPYPSTATTAQETLS